MTVRVLTLLACLLASVAATAEAQAAGSITGTVTVSGSGAPLGATSLQLYDATGTHAGAVNSVPDGTYVFSNLVPGTYYLFARNAAGYVGEMYGNVPCPFACSPWLGTPITVTANAVTSGINFALDPGASITGTLVNAATGFPIPGETLLFFNAVGEQLGSVSTLASGDYVVRNLPAGTYFVATALFRGYTNQVYQGVSCLDAFQCRVIHGTPITVAAGATVAGINFALAPPGTISGRVTQLGTGAPVPNAYITLRHEDGNYAASPTVFSAADGRYTLTGVRAGRYFAAASAPGFVAHESRTLITVTGAQTTGGVEFALSPSGSISGKVADAATNAPLSGVSVTAYNIFSQAIGGTATAFGSAAGTYTLIGLPPGAYYLRTSGASGYLDELYNDISCPALACSPPAGTPIQVTGGATTSGIDFGLTAGGRITGTVSEEGSGLPLTSGVSVSAYDSAGTLVASALTVANGAYTLQISRATGSFFLRASAYAHLAELYGGLPCPANCQVTTGTAVALTVGATVSGIDFALAKAGSITGAVTNASTATLTNITVSAYTADGVQAGTGVTDSTGRYVVHGLATGNYYLRTFATHYHKGPSFGTEYLHEAYNDVPCPDFRGTACATSGAAVAVTTGAETGNIDFALARLDATGGIGVAVSDATNNRQLPATVLIYDSSGMQIGSINPGNTIQGLAPGTYYLRGRAAGYLERFYDVACSSPCPATSGTPVVVTAGTITQGISIRLAPAGKIGGVITDATTHAPVNGIRMVVYDAAGTEVTFALTDATGRYDLGPSAAPGLATGTYFVRTQTTTHLDQQHRGRPCVDGSCVATITSGTPIAVTAGAATLGIDFALVRRAITANISTLQFAATKAAGSATLLAVTPPQSVLVDFTSNAGPWTATSSDPWLQLANHTGSGPGRFTASVVNPGDVIGAQTSLTAVITVTANAGNLPALTIPVTLRVQPSSAQTAPFGMFETPVAGATVAGSIAVTGWALDDMGVARVELWRDKVAGETTPAYAGGGLGNGKIFIANAPLIAGARPDVEAAYAVLPFANRAGWGYLLLTQGLWNQGNGTYTLHAFAYDQEGNGATLGAKTITVNNASATKPFGSIDSPAPGELVTTSFWNYGWGLTPNATPTCTIGPAGVQVSIDSGPLQPVTYGDNRPDIAAAFPGFSNGTGAGGAYYVDITTLANGTHQIGWLITDNCGRAEGVGSRFFTVLNSSGTVPLSSRPTTTVADMDLDVASAFRRTLLDPIVARRGFEAVLVEAAADGNHVVALRQGERVEVELPASGGAAYTGYQIVNGTRRALPEGSSFDGASGVFYWQPAAGFLGPFELEFVPASGGVVRVQVVVAPPER